MPAFSHRRAFFPVAPYLQCHLKFYALLCSTLAREQPELLEPQPESASRRPAPPRMPSWPCAGVSLRELGLEVENSLAHIASLLHHNQPLSALALSLHMAKALGWEWVRGPAAHLTALSGGAAPCWDQVALLSTMLDPLVPPTGELTSLSDGGGGLGRGQQHGGL